MDAILTVAGVVVLAFLALFAWAAVVVGGIAEATQERAEAIREEARRVAAMAVTDGEDNAA
jgi:uncharacterized membrane protein